MPSRTFHRVWCKNCQEFKLHDRIEDDGLQCRECNTIYTTVKLGEIPKEKIAKQRERYRDSESRMLSQVFSVMSSTYGLSGDVGINDSIVESDAGLKAQRAKEKEIRMAKQKKLDELREKAKGLGRNDPCFCGSGLKFKRCCHDKVK